MIDIHAHLLPNVDDGSQDIETSRELLINALNEGITDICLTPHFCRVDNYVLKKEAIIKRFLEFKKQVNDIKINLYLGNEIMIERNIDKILEEKKLITLNNSNYVLVEFPFDKYLLEYDDYLYDIQSLGLKIIIAHPERYQFIDLDLINKWLKEGYYLQANSFSFEVKEKRSLLYKLIENGQLHLIASDAHSIYRPSTLKSAYDTIARKFNEETANLLMYTNPYNVINNKEIIRPNKVKKKLLNL